MACPTCGAELVTIDLRIGDSQLRLTSCPPCGTREWRRDGEPADLDGVLEDLARARVRYRRMLVG